MGIRELLTSSESFGQSSQNLYKELIISVSLPYRAILFIFHLRATLIKGPNTYILGASR
jgi:hypothetical protein